MKNWYIRNFKIISIEQAKELGLKFYMNVYGDAINKLNCRSIWVDKKGRNYKVKDLNL